MAIIRGAVVLAGGVVWVGSGLVSAAVQTEITCDGLFTKLANECFEKRDCEKCSRLFADDVRKIEVALLQSSDDHKSLKPPDKKTGEKLKEEVYEACERMKRYDLETGTRMVMDPEACRLKDDLAYAVVRLYQVPNLELAKDPISRDHWKTQWNSLDRQYKTHWKDVAKSYKQHQANDVDASGAALRSVMSEAESATSKDEVAESFMKRMREINQKTFSSTEPKVLCAMKMAFQARVDLLSGRFVDLTDNFSLSNGTCCGHGCNSYESGVRNSPAIQGLKGFWTNLTSGSCSRALGFLSATFSGVFESLDVLNDFPTSVKELMRGSWTSVAAQFNMNKDNFITSCREVQKLGVQMKVSDLFFSNAEQSGVALIHVSKDEKLKLPSLSPGFANPTSPNSPPSRSPYYPNIPDWQSSPIGGHPPDTADTVHEGSDGDTAATAKDLAEKLKEKKAQMDRVFKTLIEVSDQSYAKSKSLLRKVVATAHALLKKESEMFSKDADDFKKIIAKMESIIDAKEKPLLKKMDEMHNAYISDVEKEQKRLDTEFDDLIDTVHSAGSDKDAIAATVKVFHHLETSSKVTIAKVRKRLETCEGDVQRDLKEFQSEVSQEGMKLLNSVLNSNDSLPIPAELSLSKSGIASMAGALESADAPKETNGQPTTASIQSYLTYFTTSEDGRITHLSSMKTSTRSDSDLSLRLFGWSSRNSLKPQNVTSSIYALLAFFPLFIVALGYQRWRSLPKVSSAAAEGSGVDMLYHQDTASPLLCTEVHHPSNVNRGRSERSSLLH